MLRDNDIRYDERFGIIEDSANSRFKKPIFKAIANCSPIGIDFACLKVYLLSYLYIFMFSGSLRCDHIQPYLVAVSARRGNHL